MIEDLEDDGWWWSPGHGTLLRSKLVLKCVSATAVDNDEKVEINLQKAPLFFFSLQ